MRVPVLGALLVALASFVPDPARLRFGQASEEAQRLLGLAQRRVSSKAQARTSHHGARLQRPVLHARHILGINMLLATPARR